MADEYDRADGGTSHAAGESAMRLVVTGAGGYMGRTLVRLLASLDGVRLVGALERSDSADLGADAGRLAGLEPLGVLVTDDPAAALDGADGVIDFSAPTASAALAQRAAERGIVAVIGTTGLSLAESEAVREAARRSAIVQSGNMSLGVNLLAAMVRQVAAALGEEFDVEVLEMHHNRKVDAPSGTALLLGRAAAMGRGIELDDRSVRGRDGITGPRRPGDIGFAALRGGTVVGEHAVIFAGEAERIELVHRAENREIFARGAIRAALWARGRTPGLYGMSDVLGLVDR